MSNCVFLMDFSKKFIYLIDDEIYMSKKKIILVIIIFAFTFFISDVLTYQHDSPADGSDYRGWPIRYYEYFGGECYPGPCSSRGRGFMPIFYMNKKII